MQLNLSKRVLSTTGNAAHLLRLPRPLRIRVSIPLSTVTPTLTPDFTSTRLSFNMESREKESKQPNMQLKTAKGTRDWMGSDIIFRLLYIFHQISTVFKRHGGAPLDNPVFELKEILAGKYGEESK